MKEPPLRNFVRRGFFRPAECAGKLPHAGGCGIFVAFEQATLHIYLNLDGGGLLLVGALGCCWHFGMGCAFGWAGLWVRAALWNAWRPGVGRCFEMGFALWGGVVT